LRALSDSSIAPDDANFKIVPNYGKLAIESAKVFGVLIVVGSILAVASSFKKVSKHLRTMYCMLKAAVFCNALIRVYFQSFMSCSMIIAAFLVM
jgi:hypothetical protein